MRATKESSVSKAQRLSCAINLNQSVESKSQRLSWLSRLSDDIGFLRTATQSANRDSAIFRSQGMEAQYAMRECNDNHIKHRSYSGSSRNAKISRRNVLSNQTQATAASSRELQCTSCCYLYSVVVIKSAAKKLTIYEIWMSTAELNSNGKTTRSLQ
ncbi:nuclear pore complex protein Nup205 [Dorcoceras hygrometricum]|uniref:Nuclear pore complex protein Nup205 n=1 Tax=Dorcoceras hygrometricum TaxID=472368 RepID=A0A2Z7DFE6_9LAMI|nr:nuclear pore complex protein Nup205 [Dorcoceras hygrometricum]